MGIINYFDSLPRTVSSVVMMKNDVTTLSCSSRSRWYDVSTLYGRRRLSEENQ